MPLLHIAEKSKNEENPFMSRGVQTFPGSVLYVVCVYTHAAQWYTDSLCVLSFSFSRNSSSSKVNGQMSAEIIHNGMPRANRLQTENAEVLVPMMGNHYVDTKVRS